MFLPLDFSPKTNKVFAYNLINSITSSTKTNQSLEIITI